MAWAFTAVHSGLCGYFESNPQEIDISADGRITYKGRHAVPLPPGYSSETDTLDPYYPMRDQRGRERQVYYGVDLHTQDTRDMLGSEMDEAMQIATTSQQTTKWLLTYCTSEMISKSLTLMIEAKFNWYQTNHHVGQGHGTNFISKIASTMCPWMQTSENAISDIARSTIWEIGHWVSTYLSMNLMAMRTGLRVAASPCGNPVGSVILADDMKIHCEAAPAGMAKATLLHAVMKMHHKNVLWLIVLGCKLVLACAQKYQLFLDDVRDAKETRAVYSTCR